MVVRSPSERSPALLAPPLDYRVHTLNGRCPIYDVLVQGVSFIASYRTTVRPSDPRPVLERAARASAEEGGVDHRQALSRARKEAQRVS